MAFTVPDLPYDYDALAPHIDEQTMHLHHDKHHQAYVDNANKALDGTEWGDRPVEDVLRNLDSLPQDKQGPVRNSAGGHANHSLFWEIMGPGGGGEPGGDLAGASTSARGGTSSTGTRPPGGSSRRAAGRADGRRRPSTARTRETGRPERP